MDKLEDILLRCDRLNCQMILFHRVYRAGDPSWHCSVQQEYLDEWSQPYWVNAFRGEHETMQQAVEVMHTFMQTYNGDADY